MIRNTFIDYLDSLSVDGELRSTIVEGLDIFLESINAWEPVYIPTMPFVNPVGEPMGSYQNIMKQLPTSVSMVGSGDGTTTTYSLGGSEYTRDLEDETKNDWAGAPKFRKFYSKPKPSIKRLIDGANKRMPTQSDQLPDQMTYYANAKMSNFDLDNPVSGMGVSYN